MSSATGTATIDFGAVPGSNEASVAVTGQTSILATSKADAFIMADDTTSDHRIRSPILRCVDGSDLHNPNGRNRFFHPRQEP